MDTIFGFPKGSKESGFQFKKNALNNITFIFEYSKIRNVLALQDAVTSVLGEQFPIFSTIEQIKVENRRNQEDDLALEPSIQKNTIGFSFFSEKKIEELRVEEEQLTFIVSGDSYQNFDFFTSKYRDVLMSLFEKIGVVEFKRISIKKYNLLNAIKQDYHSAPVDILMKSININLVNSFFTVPNPSLLNNCVSSLSMDNGQYQLRFAYGLLHQPNSIYNLLLDIETVKTAISLARESLFEELEILNNEIFYIFNWSIGYDVRMYLMDETK